MSEVTALAVRGVRESIVRVERRALPKYLPPEQVRRLISAARNERDRLLLEVLWQTGGRVSEVLALKAEDIDLTNRQIRLLTLKQPKDHRRRPVEHRRWIPIRDLLATDLANFLLKRSTKEARLFTISRVRAFEIVRDAARMAGLTEDSGRGISPHTLRHSFAVNCLNQGVPINVLKGLLGHSSILTTMIYLRVVPAGFRAFLGRVEF
jgi:integrase/recombinase XerD